MTFEAGFVIAVIATTVVLLVRDTVPPAIAVFGATVTLLVTGVISPMEAFSGFSNPAPITVAALFVVAAAVEKTGALQPIVKATLGRDGGGRVGLARLLFPAAGASAFLNNTPIVAMVAPQVASWADKRGLPASWFLMPLSFATILGGTLTVIGTSTNLVVSGLLQAQGFEPIGMFEITKIGLPVAIIGITSVVLLAPIVLPDRRALRRDFEENIREFVVSMTVEAGGAMDGLTVEDAGLRHLKDVFLAEIVRGEQTIAPAAPTTVLRGGDRLAFVGRVDMVRDLQTMRGLVSTESPHIDAQAGAGHTFFEAVVSGASDLAGKTLSEVGFRDQYQAAVFAIHRAGERVNDKLGQVRLRAGDTLLLVADPGFAGRWRYRSDFLLVSHLGGSPPVSNRQSIFVMAVTLGVVVVAGAGLIPILNAALLAAIALVVSGVLSPGEARRAVDMDTIIVIAAAFGIGAAIETSGLAALLGATIIEQFGGYGPIVVLLAVTLATVMLTELITNNAAAVLLFPIALATAAGLGLDPRPFAIAIMIAASASFLTPIGYQTNMMVYGMGGYRFTDYIKLGLPLTIIVVAAIVWLVPVFWPL